VADGIYTGELNRNLTWDGNEKHIIVKSENGPDNCVIDCENDGRAFCFNQTNQDTSDVIAGFTIMNGSAEGGAMLIQYSTPKLINCIFENNHSNNWENCKGGALYIISCNGLIIENCRFDDNSSGSVWGSYGGAIYILGSDITLVYCIFINNSANSIEVPAYGGAIFSDYSNIEVTNCTFYSNNAGSMYGSYGGAIFFDNSNAISINSIYWRNMSGGFQIETEDSQLTIEYCDIENNIFTGIGNIDLNPLFENPENGNLNLLPSSPCIDAGDPNPIYYDPDGTVNDMGALYYDQSGGIPYTGPVWFVAPFGNNENEGSFEFPFQTIQRGIMFAADGDTVITMDGIYCGYGNIELDFDGKSITVKSENGAEDTVIDCEQAGLGFYFHLNEDSTSVLDGFKIINGYAYTGGGIYCFGSSPTIRNMIFANNISYPDNSPWGGGGVGIKFSNSHIINSLFINNTSFSYGAGLYCGMWSEPNITNCTFVNNSSAFSAGSIMSGSFSNITISNSILWNNYPEEIGGNIDNVTVVYSDIEGGWIGEGNIDEDPMFLNPSNNDYHLLNNSPCVNAGSNSYIFWDYDLDGNPRVYDGIVDMGCYECQGTEADNNQYSILNFRLNNYPNPFNPETKINYQLPAVSKVQLSIYNIQGQKVKNLINEVLPAGEHSIIWDGEDDTGKPVGSGRKMILIK
jgi:hypothetical protein